MWPFRKYRRHRWADREDLYDAFTEAHLAENERGFDINRQFFAGVCAVVDAALKECGIDAQAHENIDPAAVNDAARQLMEHVRRPDREH